MGKDISQAVREVCLGLPETEEVISHGSPDFRVAGKTFATYVINHHGDGHLALWLAAPPGAQSMLTDGEPEYFYVPPYVGPKGWLGVDLDHGLSWARIGELVQQAYEQVAPQRLTRELGDAPNIEPPTETIDPEVFDPFVSPLAQQRLGAVRDLCLALPETLEDQQFGNPCFRAGKKNFCTLAFHESRLQLSVWVGGDAQATLTFDSRFKIPVFTGHNGWIYLDIHDQFEPSEVTALLHDSYRHFALKRMLKAMDELL